MLTNWNDRDAATPPAVTARRIVDHTLDWLQSTTLHPRALLHRLPLVVRMVRALAAVMDLHCPDGDRMCAACSRRPALLVQWPCSTRLAAARIVCDLRGRGRTS